MNFFTTTFSTTFTQCASETTEFGEIMQNKGHYALQDIDVKTFFYVFYSCHVFYVLNVFFIFRKFFKIKNVENLLSMQANSEI